MITVAHMFTDNDMVIGWFAIAHEKNDFTVDNFFLYIVDH